MQPLSSVTSGINERDQTDSDAADVAGVGLFTNGFRLLHFDTCGDFLSTLHSGNPHDVKRAVLTLYYNLLDALNRPSEDGKQMTGGSLLFSDNMYRLSSHIDDNNSSNNNNNNDNNINAFGVVNNDGADLLSAEDSDPFIRSWKASSLRTHNGGILSPHLAPGNPNGSRQPHVKSINSSPLAGILPPDGRALSFSAQSKVPLCAACIRQLFFIVATSTSCSVSALHSPNVGAAINAAISSTDNANLNNNPHAAHRQPVGDPWLEVNKTIAFIFQLIVSRGFGKALADVLLHTGVRQGTTEEARQLNSIFHCECCESLAGSVPCTRASSSPSGSDALDKTKEKREEPVEPSPLFAPPRGTIPPARIASLRLVLTFLVDAHGDAEHPLPAAEVFQALTHIRPLVKFMYAYMPIREDGDTHATPVGDAKSSEFYRTFIGQLCVFLTGPQLTSVGQAWKSLLCLLKAHRPYASVFLLYHMHCVVSEVLMTTIDDKNCVQKYYGLSLLSTILQEGAFGAASVLYATSPALLCSVLLCSNGLTSQTISQKIFEVLTKMICAPELSLPVRYILFTNRDSILRMVDYMSSLAYAQRMWDTQTFEQDRRKVLTRLFSLSPLSEDEVQAVQSVQGE